MTIEATPDGQTGSARVRGPVVVAPGEGERLEFLGGSTMVLKLSDPAEPVSFYEYTSEPSVAGPPEHVHHGHDETFYVTRGAYEFGIGDDTVVLGEGGFLSVPAGTPHTFRNVGVATGRIIGTFTSSNFPNYFRELAAIIRTTGGPPDHDDWTRLYARYDSAFGSDTAVSVPTSTTSPATSIHAHDGTAQHPPTAAMSSGLGASSLVIERSARRPTSDRHR